MAIIEVKFPQLSKSIGEITLLQWRKKPGAAVKINEVLIEAQTSRGRLEVFAPDEGVLTKILQGDNAAVTVGQILAHIDTEAVVSLPPLLLPEPVPASLAASAVTAVASANGGKTGTAMPAAAKLLAEHNLSAAQVAGTGRDGRVTKGDALAAIARGTAPFPMPAGHRPTLPQQAAPVVLETLGERTGQGVRVAAHVLQTQAVNAILTTFNEVSMALVMEMRKRFQDRFEKEHGVKLGFMSFFVKAAIHALKKYPAINASIDGNDVIYHDDFNIGITTGSPRGQAMPVLRNADQMSFAQIEQKIAELSVRAREDALGLEETAGSTFSISNGGAFGSMFSTPVVNPPQSASLGVHVTRERAVVENGRIVIRPINYLALSYDRRVIDEREAVLGLAAIKEALEDPACLLFDI
ncbi:MAG: 2-oxoglutarate dehydrogenase complex dihydrolipoyllysine-residue succinyltransferase [Burkholderiaceae bacterium]|jgi:2-oxoglutarate dehydrogenase E2 component (dihydrolipoamide succinyltransferase)|nr:2-oxoglutarate dehydrogenase complex dihydrolipoyllysine-residue succinyltransferase [Burkholderiaceae bacterium]